MGDEPKKEAEKEEVKGEEVKSETSKGSKKKNDCTPWVIIGLVAILGIFFYFKMNDQGMTDSLKTVNEVNTEDVKQWSYAVGSTVGNQLQGVIAQAEQGGELDEAVVVQAIRDVLMESEETPMTQEQIGKILEARDKMAQEKSEAQALENVTKGKEFIEAYEVKEGVKKTASGTLYTVLEEGSGVSIGSKTALVQYRGTLIDGTEFDSSFNNGEEASEPVPFTSDRLIPGLVEALEMMKKGDKWEIVVPAEGGYGEQGVPGVIGPNETLIFEINVVGIE